MKDLVLVITGEEDPMWKFLLEECDKNEKEKIFLLSTDRPDLVNTTYNPISEKVEISCGNKKIKNSEIKSIWLRRLPYPNLTHFDSKIEKYCIDEYRVFYEGLEYVFSDSLWVSKPSSINKAKSKVLQLIVAKKLGFLVSDTIFTNDPKSLLSFCKKNKSVYKSIKSPRISMSEELNRTVFTALIGDKEISLRDGLMSCPGIIQNFCDKQADIRVSVFGDKVFAIKIDSQKNENAKIDFRAGARYVPHTSFKLPKNISDLCVKLLLELDLVFGAIDLVLMKDGSFVFLEINPNGQWGWLEEKTGLPMRRALLDILFY